MIKFEDGNIVTSLSDMSFVEQVLKKWGCLMEREAEAIAESMKSEELTEVWLRDNGVYLVPSELNEDCESIRLFKVGTHKWIIEDFEPEEMEEFVNKYF